MGRPRLGNEPTRNLNTLGLPLRHFLEPSPVSLVFGKAHEEYSNKARVPAKTRASLLTDKKSAVDSAQ